MLWKLPRFHHFVAIFQDKISLRHVKDKQHIDFWCSKIELALNIFAFNNIKIGSQGLHVAIALII